MDQEAENLQPYWFSSNQERVSKEPINEDQSDVINQSLKLHGGVWAVLTRLLVFF
jgi:hypothetical protein